jgi:hypothetical protein
VAAVPGHRELFVAVPPALPIATGGAFLQKEGVSTALRADGGELVQPVRFCRIRRRSGGERVRGRRSRDAFLRLAGRIAGNHGFGLRADADAADPDERDPHCPAVDVAAFRDRRGATA